MADALEPLTCGEILAAARDIAALLGEIAGGVQWGSCYRGV